MLDLLKKLLMKEVYVIDTSLYPCGHEDGHEFRENVLYPFLESLKDNEYITVHMTGSFSSAFLQDAFASIVFLGYMGKQELQRKLRFSHDSDLKFYGEHVWGLIDSPKSRRYKIRMVCGDHKGLGHGHTEFEYYQTNHSARALKIAYEETIEKVGGVELDKILYETPREQMKEHLENFKKIGFNAIEILGAEEFDEHEWESKIRIPKVYYALWFEFVKVSLPDLEYNKSNTDFQPLEIGGYSLF